MSARKRPQPEGPSPAPKRAKVEIQQEFTPGKIISVKMTNFLTYDDAVLYPGPYMNLIIGPNGTGKSTLVCAICLALGGEPKLLKRADRIADFVKNNSVSNVNEASIEVVLASHNNSKVKIRREISRAGGKNGSSTFYINGKQAPKKEVLDVVGQLGIQVDNLCQFLPQDRVRDFAAMKPVELLRETERATIGDKHVELHDELSALQQSDTKEKGLLTEMQNKKSGLEERVKTLTLEKERIEEKQNAEEELVNLKKELEGVETRIRKFETEFGKLKSEASDHSEQFGELDKEYHSVQGELEHLKHADKDRIDTIARLQAELVKAEALANSAINQDHSSELAQLGQARQEAQDKQNKIEDKIRSKKNQMNEARAIIDANTKTLNTRIDTRSICLQRLLERIRNPNLKQSVGTAARFDENTRRNFSGRVYGPIALEISVLRPEYCNQIEAAIGLTMLRTFVVENRDDERVLLQNARVDVIAATNRSENPMQLPREAYEMGFEGFIGEFIECPPAVRNALNNWSNIHRVALARPGVDFQGLYERFQIDTIFTQTERFQMTRSRYTQLTSTSQSAVRPANILIATPDTEQEDMAMRLEITNQERRLSQIQNEVPALESEQQEMVRILNDIKARRKVLADAQSAVARTKLQVDKIRLELSTVQKKPSFAQMQAQIEKKAKANIAKRLAHIQKLPHLARAIQKVLFDQDEMVLRRVWLKKKLDSSSAEAKQLKTRVTQLEAELQKHEQTLTSIKEDYKTCKKQANEIFKNDLSTAAQTAVVDWAKSVNLLNLSVQDLQVKIETKALEIEALCVDYSALDQLQKAESELEKVETTIAQLNEQIQNKTARIEKLKADWLGPLREIVDSVNEAFADLFDQMGFVGQVKLHEDPSDFAKYEIIINVKFKDDQALRRLVSTSQSGGEQSVSTAAYLLALQTLGTSPWRLVDEINQGMDSTNERKILNLIQKASAPSTHSSQSSRLHSMTSQYFVITPKLLPNLQFEPSSVVHVIFNGPATHTPKSAEWRQCLMAYFPLGNVDV
eukprot:c16372_g1_i3.p1 GENE.c16372_g1_i3~~c16372_g1_i3.p1  ORF type:complete len:1045 (+),score=294.87 c16372_g1_i3:40-3135(+)